LRAHVFIIFITHLYSSKLVAIRTIMINANTIGNNRQLYQILTITD